jgi:hypothetical protein
MFFQNVNLNEMVMCLEDLINYFAQPEDDMGKKMHVYLFYAITIGILKIDFRRTRREAEQVPGTQKSSGSVPRGGYTESHP